MKQVWQKITPEELAKRSKTLLSEVQALSITYLWLYYSLARMGVIFNKCESNASKEPKEKRDQWLFMLDNWYRLATNYFSMGKPTVSASGGVNLAFDKKTIGWLLDRMQPVNEAQVSKARRAIGSVDLYAFMDECEARAKITDHGPYPLDKGEFLVASEYTNLHDGKGELWLPWSDTEAKLPSSTLGIGMVLKGGSAKFNDVGTMTIEPTEYAGLVTKMMAYTKRGGKIVPLGLDELPTYGEAADKAQAELYMKFAEWDRKQLLIAGAKAYWKGFARYTNQVGITQKINWDLSPKVLDEYLPTFMEVDADPAFFRMFREQEEQDKDPTLYLLPE
jgi:hypothetical protein